jgi:glutathione S-transferase
MMKLYITPASPYARLARIVVLEKSLKSQVEQVLAKTRTEDSPYYQINPSGRVPYLITNDGTGIEGSDLICSYLDNFDGKPLFDSEPGEVAWKARCLEAEARSLLDGLAVWLRETYRPENERSKTVLQHESARSQRLIDYWEDRIRDPLMNVGLNVGMSVGMDAGMKGKLNMAQLVLICALQLELRNPEFRWRLRHPALGNWSDALSERPSIRATTPEGS